MINYGQPYMSKLKKISSYSNPPTPETVPSQAMNQAQRTNPSPARTQGQGTNPSPTMNQGQGMNSWPGMTMGQGTSRPAGMYQISGRKQYPVQNQGMGTNTVLDNQQNQGTTQTSDKKLLPGKQTREKSAFGQNSAAQDKQAVEYRSEVGNIAFAFPTAPKEKPEQFSQERLQEAILWSEILGKPVSKRRKRRI